jgi:ArsR family transcriptional regulator
VPRQQPRLSVPDAARLFRLLSDQARLRLLLLLAGRAEAFVNDLAESSGRSQSSTSTPLKMLHHVGVVERRRAGQRVCYRLGSPLAAELVRRVREG